MRKLLRVNVTQEKHSRRRLVRQLEVNHLLLISDYCIDAFAEGYCEFFVRHVGPSMREYHLKTQKREERLAVMRSYTILDYVSWYLHKTKKAPKKGRGFSLGLNSQVFYHLLMSSRCTPRQDSRQRYITWNGLRNSCAKFIFSSLSRNFSSRVSARRLSSQPLV